MFKNCVEEAQLAYTMCQAQTSTCSNSCTLTLHMRELMSLVSKMYPRGLQLRNLSRVSRVLFTRVMLADFS